MEEYKNIENLTLDILDDEFINIFKPILFVQGVMGTLRVNIKHGFVMNTSFFYKVYSIILLIINAFAFVDYSQNCAKQFDKKASFSPITVGTLFNFAASGIVGLRNNILKKESNCQLYVKLQKLERELRMKNAKTLNKQLAMMSLASSIIFNILIIIFLIVLNLHLFENICPSSILIILCVLGCFYDIYLCIVILQFINVRIKYLNFVLRKGKYNALNIHQPFNHALLEVIRKIPDHLVSSMFYILETLSDFMKLYQYSVSLNLE